MFRNGLLYTKNRPLIGGSEVSIAGSFGISFAVECSISAGQMKEKI